MHIYTFSIFSVEPYYSQSKSISPKLTWVISQAGLPSHWCTQHMDLLQVPICVSLWFAISYIGKVIGLIDNLWVHAGAMLSWVISQGGQQKRTMQKLKKTNQKLMLDLKHLSLKTPNHQVPLLIFTRSLLEPTQVCIQEIQQPSEFLETFPGNLCTICRSFQSLIIHSSLL